jgi:hypothetical protein
MKIAVKKTARQVAQDWNTAHLSGVEAVEAIRANIAPMVVIGSDSVYIVADGACGFAWLEIRPARGSLVTFLKKAGIGRVDSYNRCYSVSIQYFNQSIAMKQAYAQAVANALCASGYEVFANSRED